MTGGGSIAVLSSEGVERDQESVGRFEKDAARARRGMPAGARGMEFGGAVLPLRRAL
jgi:hypothetical protein